MNVSNYAENLLLNYVLNTQSVTRPTSWYAALFSDNSGLQTDEPTTELSGNGYSRQSLTFTAAAGGSVSNLNGITFQATGDWLPTNYFGIFNTSTGGTLLFWGPLQAQITIGNGGQIQFPINSITVSMN